MTQQAPPERVPVGWPRASFVLLLPYKRTWVMRPLDRTRKRRVWDASLLRPGITGSTPESHWKNPWTYFFSKKVSRATVASGYAAWQLQNPPPVWDELPSLRPLVVERHEFWRPEPDIETRDRIGFIAVHFAMTGAEPAELELASQCLRRPGKSGSERITDLCHRAGVAASYAWGGYSTVEKESLARWGRDSFAEPEVGGMVLGTVTPCPSEGNVKHGRIRLHSNNSRAQAISFVGLSEEFASPPTTVAGIEHWTTRQAWLYQLATGMNRTRYFPLPPSTEAAAADGMFSRGSALCRVELDGLAIATDPVLARPENVHDVDSLQLLAHGRILDITMLALRQRAWLDQHTEDLARPVRRSDARETVADMIERENELVWFRNSRWFTEVPGRPEATVILRQLQSRLETPQLLQDAREEQQDLLRAASLVRQQTQLEESAESDRTRELTELAVAALAPPSLVLSLAALIGGPGVAFGFVWLLVAGVVGALAVLAVWRFRRRRSSTGEHVGSRVAESEW